MEGLSFSVPDVKMLSILSKGNNLIQFGALCHCEIFLMAYTVYLDSINHISYLARLFLARFAAT